MDFATLVEILASMAVRAAVSGSVRGLLAGDPDAVDAAINVTCEQFPDIELQPSLERWVASPAFGGALERLHAGERGFEAEFVASFAGIGQFYLPDEEERNETARRIVMAFLSSIVANLLRGEQGHSLLAGRQEELHVGTRDHVDARFDQLDKKLEHLISSESSARPGVALTDSEGALADGEHARLDAQIDLVRDLLEANKVNSARAALNGLRDVSDGTPDRLRFRVLTLLGACALAEEEIEQGCDYLEDALALRPGHATALANGAAAARLRDDPHRAVELARRSLELEPRDSHAAAVLIESLWAAGEAGEMEDFADSEAWVADDPRCGLALARIRAEQARFDEAIEIGRRLVRVDTDDIEARIVLAECLMLAAQASRASQSVASCREAEEQATAALDLLEGTELRARVLHALSIRAGARWSLGDLTGAMADAESALTSAPADPRALYNKGLLLLLEFSDFAGASAAFAGIDDPDMRASAIGPHAASALWSGDPARAAALLHGSVSLDRGDWTGVENAVVLIGAEHAIGDQDSIGPLLQELLLERPDDPPLLYLDARYRALRGDAEAAEASFLRAIKRSKEPDREKIMVGLADFYSGQERYAEAAEQYGRAVDGSVLHAAAIEHLRALWNSRQFRAALTWARTIREQHPYPPRLALDIEARILGYVGDVSAGAERWAAICARDDATAEDRLWLARTLLQCGDREGVRKALHEIDATDLRGQPRNLLDLARLKQLLGDPGYIDDAYLARRLGNDDADVHVGYFGLFMAVRDGLTTPDVVEPGCAVLLRQGDSKEWWLLLESGEEPRSDRDLRPGADLAKALLGRRQGDPVPLQEGVGELSGEVAEIQNKYVRAFQETLASFPERFPGNTDITRVPVNTDDMRSVLNVIDDRDRFARDLQRAYRDDQVPFASLCAWLGRPAPDVWRACTASGELRIRFGAGAQDEATYASNQLRDANSIVLDMLALLTVHDLGLTENLRARFSRIGVPFAVLGELRQLVDETTGVNKPRGWLGKNLDGSYAWTELSAEEWADHAEFARSLLGLAESFEAIPSYPILDLEPDERELYADALGHAGVGAVFAGGEDPAERPLLVADDYGLASIAREFGADAVNTQAVLMELRRSGDLAPDQYSVFIASLAELHYRFVQVEAADIIRLLEANGFITDDGTRALLATLEGPECSYESAVSVATDLIAEIARRSLPKRQESLLISVLLERLRRGRKTTMVLQDCLRELGRRLELAPLARDRIGSLVRDYINFWGG